MSIEKFFAWKRSKQVELTSNGLTESLSKHKKYIMKNSREILKDSKYI